METSGATITFATGATSESIPNVATVSGAVAACATSVIATGSAIAAGPKRGSASETHRAASRANTSSPATAATESWNPRSNAVGGHDTSARAIAAASEPSPSLRLPASEDADTTAAMRHARTADGCTPEATT